MNKSIGDILKEERISKDLAQHEVAKKVGVTEATISRWVPGNIKNMRRDKVVKVSKVLNISTLLVLQ